MMLLRSVFARLKGPCLLWLALTNMTFANDETALDFARHVQPILALKCAKCHGPSATSGGIAFDTRERALSETDSGKPAIVPNDPDASSILERITSHDESVRMPPEGKPLTPTEVEIVKKWIRQGANWSQHWAYRPLQKPAIPEVKRREWCTNDIDRFVLAGLEESELSPNGFADKRSLVRRAYYNLIGLPPTPEQVSAFESDRSVDAWEKLIDQLLQSPQYGEHWGRKWLDVVRYAETNSFERDNPKPHVWRYRDYVIRSINEDKPYDRFLFEQLAGDEVAQPSADQLIATGFYRLGVWDDEPADRDLAMYEGFDDLITTIGQGMLGLTFNCARCHDHKIDPIPQTDYYQLLAFLRNIRPMSGSGPNIEENLFASDQSKREYDAAVRDKQEQMGVAKAEVSRLEEIFLTLTANEFRNNGEAGGDMVSLKYRQFNASFDRLPDFDKLTPSSSDKLAIGLFDTSVVKKDREFAVVFEGELIVPEDGSYQFFINSDDGSRLWIDQKAILTHDGIHGIEEERNVAVQLSSGKHLIRLDYFQRQHGLGLRVAWSGPGFERRLLSRAEKSEKGNKNNFAQRIKKRGLEVLGADEFAKYESALKTVAELQREPPVEKALVVKEVGMEKPADVFVLKRGMPGNHGALVEPGFPNLFKKPTPSVKPVAGQNSSGRRTALANWIASPDNLLTARVFVNRIWQGHFGRGIVRSSNNFGGLGTPPTHPELLDWLAADFVSSGWKIKRLHKLIMLSSAYRMSSAGQEAAIVKDPANDRFWRVDMRRLSAEEIRDSLLSVNGRLNSDMFGPSIYPVISTEVLAGQSVPGKGWGKSTPAEQARRSVYIHVKRSLITPLLASFDYPETDTSCEARFTTTQPGQSFAMLNGQFANDQAAEFAKRILAKAEHTNRDSQIQKVFEICFQRSATESEKIRGRAFMSELEQKYQLSPERALENYCLFVLNLNEFIYLE